ncbi:MAG TPA: serine/threonine-protein kinase, partial [Nannocystaceae bacterium]|nr:serine/threonine-protein kinase [Nannocystaceae bacterium]
MSSVTLFDRQEEVRSLESRLIKALTLARLGGGALTTQDGRFKVRRMLGRGASGVVCAAEDTKMERELAFKLYPGLADDRLAEGVRAEARALAKLKHPNVVTVHDFDASVLRPGEIWCFYVSMELLGGPSLRRWLAEGQDVGRAIEMFCQAGDGLAAAHAAGLVHRDVKPENVMLDGKTPKIVDFGLARDAVVTTGLAAADAHQRAIVGTLAYMAPEALEGRADARSDVFSFAAAVWEACYGEFPYAIDTLDPAARRRIAPPSRRGALPEGLFGCLSRALRGDPRERTGSIAELVAELRSLVPIVDEMVAARVRAVAGAGSTMSAVVPIAAASARAPARRAADAAGTLLSFVL